MFELYFNSIFLVGFGNQHFPEPIFYAVNLFSKNSIGHLVMLKFLLIFSLHKHFLNKLN